METIYNTKFIQSGDRLEVYKYRGYVKKGGTSRNKEGRRGKSDISDEEKAINHTNNRLRNLNNAKNNIVRIISCNKNDLISFITLTYAENVTDVKKSKKHLNKFFKKLKEVVPDIKYLYVMEFQERGAIHYHILCNFPINHITNKHPTQQQKDYNLIFKNKYWKYGWCDCRNLKTEGNTNIAKYISAYLTSDLYCKDLNGCRCFGTSRNLARPIITTIETKYTSEQILNTDGYELQYYNNYSTGYRDKNGKDRKNNVSYYDFTEKE